MKNVGGEPRGGYEHIVRRRSTINNGRGVAKVYMAVEGERKI